MLEEELKKRFSVGWLFGMSDHGLLIPHIERHLHSFTTFLYALWFLEDTQHCSECRQTQVVLAFPCFTLLGKSHDFLSIGLLKRI